MDDLRRIEDKLDAIISFFGIDKKRFAPCQVQKMASDDVQEFLRRELQKHPGPAGSLRYRRVRSGDPVPQEKVVPISDHPARWSALVVFFTRPSAVNLPSEASAATACSRTFS